MRPANLGDTSTTSTDMTPPRRTQFSANSSSGRRSHISTPQPTARKSTAAPPPRLVGARRRKPVTGLRRENRMLRTIKKLQMSTNHLIPKLPFSRLVREIMRSSSQTVWKITFEALVALQEAAEMYIVQQMSDAYLLTMHRGRVTLSIQDMEVLRMLRKFQ